MKSGMVKIISVKWQCRSLFKDGMLDTVSEASTVSLLGIPLRDPKVVLGQ